MTFLPLAEELAGPNGRSSGVRFRFQMFRFTAGPDEFYLHCSVQLCERDDQPSCLPVSPGPVPTRPGSDPELTKLFSSELWRHQQAGSHQAASQPWSAVLRTDPGRGSGPARVQ